MLTRKIVKVYVSFDLIVRMMTQDNEIQKTKTTEGLPPDAQFIYNGYDQNRGEAYFIFTHDSFPEIYDGGSIPEFRIRFTEQHDN